MKSNNTGIIIYQSEDGVTKIDVRMEDETVWLSLDQIAELFQRDKSTISRHIKNVLKEGELTRNAVVAKYATTAADAKTYQVDYYNLDVIISVGYRVKSLRGTQFRMWATKRLREYIVKGFTMNDDLLKKAGGGNYWKELMERIRDIRSSEKVFYRQLLDLFATSIDYNKDAKECRQFFKKDWLPQVDDFAQRYGKGILQNAGTVSRQAAIEKATEEYKKYRKRIADLPSAAERDYLESIKQAQKKLKGKTGGERE